MGSGDGLGQYPGLFAEELFVGSVSGVTANDVRVNLHGAEGSSGLHFLGHRYGRGEVGEFVVIASQTCVMLGRIVETRLPEKERVRLEVARVDDGGLDVVGVIQLLASVSFDRLKVTPGVEAYPRLGDRVYSAPHDFIADLPTLMEDGVSSTGEVRLSVGRVTVGAGASVSLKPEVLFGRHCAVLGATGGGKSWTVARLLEGCRRYRSRVVLIDATAEYSSMSGNDVVHYHLGTPVKVAPRSTAMSVPPNSFVESDFLALFEPAGKVQGPKMREAIRSLRLAELRPDLAPKGIIMKIDQDKRPFTAAMKAPDVAAKLANPQTPFAVERLPDQIEQECVYSEGFLKGGARGEKDPNRWGGDTGDFSHCVSLVSRIEGVLSSSAFECVFGAEGVAMSDAMDRFQAGRAKVIRICMSGIAYEFGAREVIANAVGRHLLNQARGGAFKDEPVLLVVDEAHCFVGKRYAAEDSVAQLDAFEIVAREGRKYGLCICLVTQRPRDVTVAVLSEIGTLVVHRLTSDRDRAVVEAACGDIDRTASAFLPNLRPGEAVIIGTDSPIPLTVQVEPPTEKPESEGPDFQRRWIGKETA